jgi:hypothetical protein
MMTGKHHNANSISQNKPGSPREEKDTRIVRAAIHPSIGVGRVGNSQDEFFIGPEVINPLPAEPGFYRSKDGTLKRQAARFRIYGLNAKGEAVKELTLQDAEIEWSVHLANKKASWYQFQLALDIPEAAAAMPSLLRNSSVKDRTQLTIDPGCQTITGNNANKQEFIGKFLDIPVYLGELHTDESGRLLVLGGRGKSASYNGNKAITFANNDGWYDDTSDGPVTAKVKLGGVTLEVDPAWVVITPPNYAPLQKSVRTMWDLIRDIFFQDGTLEMPTLPSFQKDIRPIFERLTRLQWVNAGFAAAFGWKEHFNFTSREWMEKLSDPNPSNREMKI